MNPFQTKIPATANQVIISVNPKAGRRLPKKQIDRLTELLTEKGFAVDIMTDLGRVSEEANRLFYEERLRALVGVGGDGTAAELVNRTEPGVPITLLPAGTANLISKYLRLSKNPKRMVRLITEGRLLTLDAGRANGRLFLVMVSCGFDAEIVSRVHAHREANPRGAHISYWTYVKPIWRALRKYKYPGMHVSVRSSETDGGPTEIDARWAFIFNLPCYGWGLPLAPKAVGADGVLDACAFRGSSFFSGLKYVATAQCGSLHRHLRDCDMSRGTGFAISASSETPVPYQLDGDPGGVLPVDIEILPNRLTLVVPEAVQRKHAPPSAAAESEEPGE